MDLVTDPWSYVVHKIDEISSLSILESAKLIGNYLSIVSGKEEIDPSLASRGYSPEALEMMKRRVEAGFEPVTSHGLRFTKPLGNFKSDILGYSMTLLENYERGALPYPGPFSEQPAQVIEIFGLLQSLRHEQQEIQRKKVERDVRQKHQGRARNSR